MHFRLSCATRWLFTGLLAAAPLLAWGTPPRLIGYSGTLEHGGVGISRTLPIRFCIVTSATGRCDSALWDEVQDVTVFAGKFHVQLGSVKALPDSAFLANDLYLRIAINGTELAGTQRILAAPYAMTAAQGKAMLVSDELALGVTVPREGPTTSPGYGTRVTFSGGPKVGEWDGDNSDPIWMARYNAGTDASELHICLGDMASPTDKLVIGTASSPGSFSPAASISATGDINAQGSISAVNATLSGNLKVNGTSFGRYVGKVAKTVASSEEFTEVASSDGFVVAHASAAVDGARGWLAGKVREAGSSEAFVVAQDSLHYWPGANTLVGDCAIMFPVARGSTYTVRLDVFNPNISYWVRFMPFAP